MGEEGKGGGGRGGRRGGAPGEAAWGEQASHRHLHESREIEDSSDVTVCDSRAETAPGGKALAPMRGGGVFRPNSAAAAPHLLQEEEQKRNEQLDHYQRARAKPTNPTTSLHDYNTWKRSGKPQHATQDNNLAFGMKQNKSEQAGNVIFPQQTHKPHTSTTQSQNQPVNIITWENSKPEAPPPPPSYLREFEAKQPQPMQPAHNAAYSSTTHPPDRERVPFSIKDAPLNVATCMVELPVEVEQVDHVVPSLLGLGVARNPSSLSEKHYKSQSFTKEFGPSSFYY